MSVHTNAAQLREALEALPAGSSLSLPRETLLELLGDAPPPPPPDADQLISAKEAGKRLGVSPRWLYRNAETLPFAHRLSDNVVRFSAQGLERWVAKRGGKR